MNLVIFVGYLEPFRLQGLAWLHNTIDELYIPGGAGVGLGGAGVGPKIISVLTKILTIPYHTSSRRSYSSPSQDLYTRYQDRGLP